MTELEAAAERLRRIFANETYVNVYGVEATSNGLQSRDTDLFVRETLKKQACAASLECPKCDGGIAGIDRDGESIDCHYCEGIGELTAAAFVILRDRFESLVGDAMLADENLKEMKRLTDQRLVDEAFASAHLEWVGKNYYGFGGDTGLFLHTLSASGNWCIALYGKIIVDNSTIGQVYLAAKLFGVTMKEVER